MLYSDMRAIGPQVREERGGGYGGLLIYNIEQTITICVKEMCKILQECSK